MRAPGTKKRFERAQMIEAAKEFNALEERYYYTDDLTEAERRTLEKQLRRAQWRLNRATLAYCLGYHRTSMDARLKRRSARRKAAAQTTMVAA